MHVYLGLGTNLGERKNNLNAALEALKNALGAPCSRISSIWETEAWGFDGEDFLNLVARYDLSQDTDPFDFLEICKQVESSLGRPRKETVFDESGNRVYENRLIDIDVLFFGDRRMKTSSLTLPHPLIKQRGFVMNPLMEIADDELKEQFPEIFETK